VVVYLTVIVATLASSIAMQASLEIPTLETSVGTVDLANFNRVMALCLAYMTGESQLMHCEMP
jgi:hypothetical protein